MNTGENLCDLGLGKEFLDKKNMNDKIKNELIKFSPLWKALQKMKK